MYRHILIAVDLTDDASWKRALPTAVEYCKAFGSTLHVMTVVPDFGMTIVGQFFPTDFEDEALEAARKALHDFCDTHVPADVTRQHVIGHGSVYEQILIAARKVEADLVVMGAHRPELQDYLLGPNAARVVRHFERSVLVVRD